MMISFILYVFAMSVLVYNGEKFQRSKLWYLVFTVIFASVFLLSILNKNIVGAILLFFLLGWYFYYSTINNQVITLSIHPDHFMVGSKKYLWNAFVWYALELDPKTQNIKNLVLLTSRSHIIYTFDDLWAHIKSFLLELDTHLPMVEGFQQTTFEKVSRKIQL